LLIRKGRAHAAGWRVRWGGRLALPAGLVVLGFALGCDAGVPAIEVARTSLDLGEIGQGPAETTVSVSNIGGDSLRILWVATSCGCTSAWVSDSLLAPGATTTLSVRYDPTVMTPPDTGRIHRGIYIQSNDPVRPEVEIDLYAVVRPPELP